MAYTAADIVKEGVKKGLFVQGDDPYGLFCGEAGRAWGWYTLVAGGDKGMIGYSDV